MDLVSYIAIHDRNQPMLFDEGWLNICYRGADKSLARPTSRCILFNGENISFDASLVIYRVIHKSVKHFKNSQQIDYSTDHDISYADRERNSPSFFYVFHRCSIYPPLVIRQTSLR